jgi:hypothetical protein
MATSDYDMALQLNGEMPHTFNCLQELVMRMADYSKHKDAWTWWGKKKSLKAWIEFEAALKEIIVALYLDEIVGRDASANEIIIAIQGCIQKFSEVFPNWQDAYSFSEVFFIHSPDKAISLVNELRS